MRGPAWSCLVLLGCRGGLDRVAVEENPVCALSAVVRWTTAEPATSWVEFGEGDALTRRVGSDAPVTEHEVVVVGMHARLAHTLVAVSTDEQGRERRSDPQDFTTGEAAPLAAWTELLVRDEARAQPGWTLTNAAVGNVSPVVVAMLDEEGQPVWTYALPDSDDARGDVAAGWLDEGLVLVGPAMPPGRSSLALTLDGRVAWQGFAQPEGDGALDPEVLAATWHHVLARTDEGLWLSVQAEERDGEVGDRVVLADDEGETAWSWSAWDHLEPDPDVSDLGGWSHLNSVAVRPDDLTVNSYMLAQTYRIDRASGEILWTLGEGGDFAADPDAEHPFFAFAHSVEVLDDDRLLLYDNGPFTRGFTRVVEYTLDREAMTSRVSWEYPGELARDDWYTLAWGDVDPLDNGDLLITNGLRTLTRDQARIWEVTRAGETVWEVQWTNPDQPVSSFAAERIPALAEPL